MTGPAHAAGVYNKASTLARAIVAKRVTILAGAGIILGELVRAGVLPDQVSGQVATILGLILDALGVITGIIWAQQGTTPADPALQPRASTGELLVPISDYEAPFDGETLDGKTWLIQPKQIDGQYVGSADDTVFPLTPVPTAPEESA